MIGLFIITPIYFSNMPVWSRILLELFCADLLYFLFVVLKVQRNLSKRINPITNTEQQAHLDAMAAARKIAQSGIVLLQNTEDLLPLSKGAKLNLIGLRCVQMNYNGGGSVASDESKCTTLEAALRETSFELNQDLLNLSYNYLKNESVSIAPMKKNNKVKQGNRQKGGAEFIAKPGSPVKTELPVAALTSKQLYPDGRSILEHAKEFSNIALVVLSRGCGEGYIIYRQQNHELTYKNRVPITAVRREDTRFLISVSISMTDCKRLSCIQNSGANTFINSAANRFQPFKSACSKDICSDCSCVCKKSAFMSFIQSVSYIHIPHSK